MTEEGKEILSAVKDMFEVLNDKIDKIDNKVDQLDKKVEKRFLKIETTLENDVNRKIDLLTEGYSSLVERIDIIDKKTDKIEPMQADIEIIKKAVVAHSSDLNKLKKVK